MASVAHTYTPQNNSFEERVHSCKSVLKAYRNVRISLGLANEKDWAERLGTPEEIEYANLVMNHSLQRATAAIQYSELYYAQEQGLLTKDDVQQLSTIKGKGSPEKFVGHGPDDDFGIDGPGL